MSETNVYVVDSSIREKGLHKIDLGEYGDFEVVEIETNSVFAVFRGIWTPHPERPDINKAFPVEPEFAGIAPRKTELMVWLHEDTDELDLEQILKSPWFDWNFDTAELPELEIVASDSSLDESWGVGYAGVDGEVIPVTWVAYNNEYKREGLVYYRPATEGDAFIDCGGAPFVLHHGRWVDPDDAGVEIEGDSVADWATFDDPKAKVKEDETKNNVFRSFNKLGVDQRSGVQITKTDKGHRIETFSAYSDEKEYIYYVSFDDVPADVDWNEVINDYGTTLLQLVLEKIRVGAIRPYRTIVKDR